MEESDFALALALQNQLDNDITGTKEKSKPSTNKPKSVVDPEWELIDPNPDIYVLFDQFNQTYFWNALSMVEVKWSPRMTLCAGLCCYEGRGRLCSIRLSQPLLKLRPRKDLVETLLHEMIHAYLFVTENNKDREGHGPEFCKHMRRINTESGTNITIYHSFHDEVNEMRKHWWRCEGRCRNQPPYFGYVKRSMNRQPSKNDLWWSDHERSCGGKFVKIKEPEDYGKKQKASNRKSNDASSSQPDSTQRTLPFTKPSTSGQSGNVLGGRLDVAPNSRGIPQHSRLLTQLSQNLGSTRISDRRGKVKDRRKSANLTEVCQRLRRSGARSVNEGGRAYDVCKVKTKFSSAKAIQFSSDEEMDDASEGSIISSREPFVFLRSPFNGAKNDSASLVDARLGKRKYDVRPHAAETSISPLKKKPNSDVVPRQSRSNDCRKSPNVDDRSSAPAPTTSRNPTSTDSPIKNFTTDVILIDDAGPAGDDFDSINGSASAVVDSLAPTSNPSEDASLVPCPVCSLSVPLDDINTHIDICLSLKAIQESNF